MMQLRFLALSMVVALWTAAAFSAEPPADPATIPPPLNVQPGPEYGDEVRMFQGIPSLERAPQGRLWATWYGGGVTEDHHNYILLVTSGDDGRTWSELKLVLDPDRDGPVRAFDPCPWLDPTGRLWLFWAQRASGLPSLFAVTTQNADDENPTWSPPRRICEGIMMCKPTVTRDGAWLLPTAVWHREGSCRVVASTDQGATWALRGAATVPDPKDRNCDEPMLVERRDGSLWMWVRTRYGIGQSVSADGGRSWSAVAPGPVAHTTARFFVRRLVSGNLLLVKHGPLDVRAGRSHLTAYVSNDDGGSWQGGLLLDERSGVSYPDGFQGADGRLYIIHDFDRQGAKEILLSVFTEADVLAGKDTSGQLRLRVLINRATGENPGKRRAAAEPITLDPHRDGARPLDGAGAAVKPPPAEDEVATLVNGVKLFTDRDYVAANLPSCVQGRQFLRTSIRGAAIDVTRDGVVFALTPLPQRNQDNAVQQLTQQGFAKAAVPEFLLFGSPANICTTFQKKAQRGETVTIGKWGILVFGDGR